MFFTKFRDAPKKVEPSFSVRNTFEKQKNILTRCFSRKYCSACHCSIFIWYNYQKKNRIFSLIRNSLKQLRNGTFEPLANKNKRLTFYPKHKKKFSNFRHSSCLSLPLCAVEFRVVKTILESSQNVTKINPIRFHAESEYTQKFLFLYSARNRLKKYENCSQIFLTRRYFITVRENTSNREK